MIKVDQTVVDADKGNCMQAALASILEKPLEEIPDFGNMPVGHDYYGYAGMFNYMIEKHNKVTTFLWNPDYYKLTPENKSEFLFTTETFKDLLIANGGEDGYYYAGVPSATFEDVGHAVVVDKDFNVVHDPNPNRKTEEYGLHKIEYIIIFEPMEEKVSVKQT